MADRDEAILTNRRRERGRVGIEGIGRVNATTEDEHAANRRVEFVIIKQGPKKTLVQED